MLSSILETFLRIEKIVIFCCLRDLKIFESNREVYSMFGLFWYQTDLFSFNLRNYNIRDYNMLQAFAFVYTKLPLCS